MLLELQEPFKSLWKKGYLRTRSEDQRKIVDLYNSEQDRTSISYARYLMCVKLGYILSDEFEVDHKDNDKTNDNINNLQVLTKEENIKKEIERYADEEKCLYSYLCAQCNGNFIIDESERNKRIATSKTGLAFCSRSCSAKYNSLLVSNVGKSLGDEKIKQIKDLRQQGLSVYKINEQTGIARNTIMKYW